MSVPRLHDTNPVIPRSIPESPDRFFSRRGLKSQNTPRVQTDSDPTVTALRPSLFHAPEPKLSSLYKRKQTFFDSQDREAAAAKLRPVRIRQDKEQLYEDALTLKMENNSLRGDNTRLRTRMNQLEKDLARKDEFLEELRGLSEEKQFSSVLAHSHLVAGLKQVNKDLRTELGAKEIEFERLKRSAKITKVAELETELKVYIEECQRLKDCLIEEPPEQTQQTKAQSRRHLEVENVELAGALTEAQVEIERLSHHVSDLEAQIRTNSKRTESPSELTKLQAKMQELESEKSTKIQEYANELEVVFKEREDERTAKKALEQEFEKAKTDLKDQKTVLQGMETEAIKSQAENKRLLDNINILRETLQKKSEFARNLTTKTMKRKLIRRGVQLQDFIDRSQSEISVWELKRILKENGIKIKTWQLRGLVESEESSLISIQTLLKDLLVISVKSVKKSKRQISIQRLSLITIEALQHPADSSIPSIPLVSAGFPPIEIDQKSADRRVSSSSSPSSVTSKKAEPVLFSVQATSEFPERSKERISSFSNSRKRSDSEISDKEAFATQSPTIITKGKETVGVYEEKPLFFAVSEVPESAQNPSVEIERKSISSDEGFPAEKGEGEKPDFALEKPAETFSPEVLDMPDEAENPSDSPDYIQEDEESPGKKSESPSLKDSGIVSNPSNHRSHDIIHPKSPNSPSQSSSHSSDHGKDPESAQKQEFEIDEISPKSRDSQSLQGKDEIPRLDPVISGTESAVEPYADFVGNQEKSSDVFVQEELSPEKDEKELSESAEEAEVFEYEIPEETPRENVVSKPEINQEIDFIPEKKPESPPMIKAEITVEEPSEKRGSVLDQPEMESIQSAAYFQAQENPISNQLDSQPSATGFGSPEPEFSHPIEDIPEFESAPPSLPEPDNPKEGDDTTPQDPAFLQKNEPIPEAKSDSQDVTKQELSAEPAKDTGLTAALQPDPETLGRVFGRIRLSLQAHSIARSRLREVFLGVRNPEDVPIAIELEDVFERPPFDLGTDAVVLSRYIRKTKDNTTWGEVLEGLETRLQDWEILGKVQEDLRNQQLTQLFGQLSTSFLREAEAFEIGSSDCVSLAAFDSLLRAHDLRLDPGLKDYIELISFTETKELDCVPYKKLKKAFSPRMPEPSGKVIEWKFSGDQQEALAKECALLLSTRLMDRGLNLRAVFQAKLKETLTLEEFESGLSGLQISEVVGEQTKALAEILKTEEDPNLISVGKLEALLVHFGVTPFPSPRILT